MGPFLVPLLGSSGLSVRSLQLQVAIFLQWVQWLWAVPLRNRDVVCINIDETPLYKQLQPRKGYVLQSQRKHDLNAYARVPLRDRRGQATLLGCIADDFELHRALPQFVLTNDKNLSRAEKAVLAVLPSPLQWVHPSKGWVTTAILKQLITRLRRAVRAERPAAEVVLFMDCATIHISDELLKHCSILNVHPVLIPAGLTYLLQPLDSHVFGSFKRELSEMQEKLRGEHPLGILQGDAWLNAVSSCVLQHIVHKDWTHAFGDNGMLQSTGSLRARIQGLLGGCRLPLPLRLPSDEELGKLVGRSRVRLSEVVYRASKRLAQRPVAIMPHPIARLPPAPPDRRHGAASSSSGGPLRPPPLPPPAHPHPDDVLDAPRLTRSGSRY